MVLPFLIGCRFDSRKLSKRKLIFKEGVRMEDIFDKIQAITGISKYSNSEVITPKWVVTDMVDLLPPEIFNSEAKFLDPAAKSGRFLAEIYSRLFDSPLLAARFPNEADRRQHILKNQLYGLATSATAATIVRKQLYDDPTIAGNIVYTADKVTKELIQGAFGIMKFDVVIGNPPYNKDIFLDFVSMGYDLSSQYTCMITPAKWQTNADNARTASKVSYKQFRDKLAKHISHVVFYPACKDVFDILQVDGIAFYLIDEDDHEKAIVENRCKHIPQFNSTETRCILNRESLFNIGNEIIEYLGNYKSFKFGYEGINGKFQVWTNTQVPGGGLSTLEAPRQTQFVGASYIEEDIGIDIGHSTASICTFASNSKQECEYFVSWLNTKFTRFFVAINISKLTGIIDDDHFRFVPAPPSGKFDHIYTDDELYKAFNLPQKYIDVIEAIVKERK